MIPPNMDKSERLKEGTTVYVIDYEGQFIKEEKYSNSPYWVYYNYDFYLSEDEAKKEMVLYWENKVYQVQRELKEVKKKFK